MSNNKSPGLDDFGVEFYKFFSKDSNDLLLGSYQFLCDSGVFTDAQREEIIFLIPKRNKDPLLSLSYRPITLLNIDFKMIVTFIESRLKCYLNELIRPGQNAFIKGNGDSIKLLFDVINLNKIPRSIYSLQTFLKPLIHITGILCFALC